MKAISYISSLLDMEAPLARKRLLAVKGKTAKKGTEISPILEINPDSSLEFMSKAITQIRLSLKAKRVNLPGEAPRVSKYQANIS